MAQIYESDRLEFFRWKDVDGGVLINGYEGAKGFLQIPEEIDGKPVVAISAEKSGLISNHCRILVPATVRQINLTDFHYLAYTSAPEKNKDHPGQCLELVENHPHLQKKDDFLLSKDGTRLVSYLGDDYEVKIPEGVKVIGENAFGYQGMLQEVILPSTLEEIEDRAFGNLHPNMALPEGMKRIGSEIMTMDGGIYVSWSRIKVSTTLETLCNIPHASFLDVEKNPHFKTIRQEGKTIAILSTDGKQLLAVDLNVKEFDVPEGVEEIMPYAFCNTSSLKKLTLPSTLRAIGRKAFCANKLKTLRLPASLEIWEEDAYDAQGLNSILLDKKNPWLYTDKTCLYRRLDGDKMELLTCFRPKLEEYEIPEGVVSIREKAFANCTELKRLVLPQSLESYDQTTLLGFHPETNGLPNVRTLKLSDRAKEDLDIRDNETFFMEDHVLYERTPEGLVVRQCIADQDQLTIKEGTIRIAAGAFSGKCRSITFPASLRVIEDGACVHLHLEEVIFQEGLEVIQKGAFQANDLKKVTLPASLRYLALDAFGVCPMEEYQVAEGSAYYAAQDGALYSADGTTLYRVPTEREYKEFVVPAQVTDISHAFYGCDHVKAVRLPDGLKKIWSYALVGCAKLKHLYVGNGLEYVDDDFINVDSATTIHADRDSVIRDFYGKVCKLVYENVKLKFSINGMEDLPKLSKEFLLLPNDTGITIAKYMGKSKETVIPETLGQYTVTAIGPRAFSNQPIKAVTIPETVTSIGTGAFYYCTGLESISLPAGLKEIPEQMLYYCQRLKNLTISEGVEKIGAGALFACDHIEKCIMPASICWISPNLFAEDESGRYKDLYDNKAAYQVVPGSYAETFLKAYKVDSYRRDALKVVYAPGENPLSQEEQVLEYLGYTVGEDGTAAVFISKEVPETYTECVIPETINGVTVTSLVHNGSTIPAQITRLSLPSTVREIQIAHALNEDAPGYMGTITVAEENPVFWTDGHALYSKDRTRLIRMMNYQTESYTVLPETKVIEELAFERMSRLKTLILPQGLQEIGERAFRFCKIEDLQGIESVPGVTAQLVSDLPWYVNQKVLYLGTTLVHYKESEEASFTIREGTTRIAGHAFRLDSYWMNGSKDKLEEIIIPDSVTTIGANAFIYREHLKSLNLPPKLDAIPANLLEVCPFIEDLYIPETVLDIDPTGLPSHRFNWNGTVLSAFRHVEVAAENPNYKSVDGVLYTKDGTVLVRVPPCYGKKEFIVPDGVTTVGDYAFRYIQDLERVILPDSVTTIGVHAFENCVALTDVVFGGTKNICSNAFAGCEALKHIRFPETLEKIGESAFCRSGVTHVVLPKSVKTVGAGAFFPQCEQIEFYDTIDPTLEKYVTGCPGVMVVGEQRNRWQNHELIVRSAETGEIKYRLPMFTNGDDKNFAYVLRKSWDAHGQFKFKDLDNHFQEIKGVPYKIRAAVNRLQWPMDLSDTDREDYVRYLVRMGKDVVKYCVDQGNMEILELCAPLGVLKKNNIDELIEYAAQNQSVEISACLMNYKAEHFASKKGGTSLSLSLKAAPIWTAPKTGTKKIGRYKGSDTVVEFPTEWNGETLTGVANTTSKVPENYKAITAVVIPEGYISIGDYAFCGCENLESVTLPSTLESIGKYAFCKCRKLKEIVLPDSVTSLGECAFSSCTGLKKIQLPAQLGIIPEYTFNNCTSLQEIDLPKKVFLIGKGAFYETTALSKFTIRGKTLASTGQIFWNTPPVYCYPDTKIDVFGIRKKDIHHITEDGTTSPEQVVYTELDSITVQDQIFVLSGFGISEEMELTRIITEKGGQVKSSVVLKTNYLLMNENYGGVTSKYQKAMELNANKGKNIAVISKAKFEELIK